MSFVEAKDVMDVIDIVNKVNVDGVTLKEIAEDLSVSTTTLSRRLKKEGYYYDNSKKKYEKGENNSEKVQKKVEVKKEEILTKEEISFVKNAYKRGEFYDKKFEITWEKSNLPPRKPEKKTPYIISQQTFEEFRSFSENLENELRITQNELVEIALSKFMREFEKS